jgi:uncharacterized protein with NAD-binding domain and iron-sulfur cluster
VGGQQNSRKVAVLGGGPAALAAAFALSDPALGGRFEVTVYQPGWRLGGKCASGRNQERHRGMRIEEHGLHVWFGFYENAFSVVRRTYDELNRPANHPMATFKDAFVGCDEIVLFDRQGKGWQDFAFKVPPNCLEPGAGGEKLPGFWKIATWLCEWAIRDYRALDPSNQTPGGPTSRATGAPGGPEAPAVPLLLRMALAVVREAQDRGTELLPLRPPQPQGPTAGFLGLNPERLLADLLGEFREWLWANFWELFERNAQARLYFTMFDTFASATIGIVADDVLAAGWESINHLDLAAWLGKHGAKPITLGDERFDRSPMLRSIYDVAFGYQEGNVTKGNISAGTAINDYLRLQFTYRGHLMWKMQAGMGDAVIAPLYLLLKARKVKFKFFHSVEAIRLDATGTRVEQIDVVAQLGPNVDVSGYEPLIEVPDEAVPGAPAPVPGAPAPAPGAPALECWPSEPLWDELPGSEEAASSGHDYEQEPNPDGVAPSTLECGAGKDFEDVVLAIPVSALPAICADVSAKLPRFEEMLKHSETIATQAFQLWTALPLGGLGWVHSENSVAGCYVEPIDTWADMTHLLHKEHWSKGDGVSGLAYFCGVLEDVKNETPAEANARVKANVERFLIDHVGPLWPRAVRAGKIYWPTLADPGRETIGPARLNAQYWRANVSATERYVLTPADSVRYRLAASGSGVTNLALAGDWTRNGIDGGCVEAAMTSGLQAAAHLSGGGGELTGASPTWLSGGTTGRVSMPPPLRPDGSGDADSVEE